jgi:hypothetical protein
MAKRKRSLPHGTLGKPIVLGIEDWQATADAAQIELTRPVLARLCFATMVLAAHGQLERSAPPKAVLDKIKRLKNVVSDLRGYFPNDSDEASQLFFSNLTEIRRYVTRSKEQTGRVGLMFLLELLSHVLMLNQKLLNEILTQASHQHPVFREGDVWDLCIIFKRASLPTAVRNDEAKPSRFVIFVRELQKRLPAHLYRTRSDNALAKAITRAREGCEELIATGSLEFLLLNFLGALRPVALGEGHEFEVEPKTLRSILETLDYADKPNI